MKTIITIFGSTGDLTIRKLLPAINHLLEENLLPDNTKIFAIGRRDIILRSISSLLENNLQTNMIYQD